MNLPGAIKEIVNKFGKEELLQQRFTNLISDYMGFVDYPALKRIFRDLANDKIIEEVYHACEKTEGSELFIKLEKTGQEFASRHKYKKDLVSYGIDSLLFALNKLQKVNEPFSNAYDASVNSSDLISSLNQKLAELKKQYIDGLEKLPVQPKDLIKDAPAYYTTKSLNYLYGIQTKIKVLTTQLNVSDSDWCENKLKEKIKKLKEVKANALLNKIEEKKKEYEKYFVVAAEAYQAFLQKYQALPNSDADLHLMLADNDSPDKESAVSASPDSIKEEILSLYNQLGRDYSSDVYWSDTIAEYKNKQEKIRDQLVQGYKSDYVLALDEAVQKFKEEALKENDIPKNYGLDKVSEKEKVFTEACEKFGITWHREFIKNRKEAFEKEKANALPVVIIMAEQEYSKIQNSIPSLYRQYQNGAYGIGKDKYKDTLDKITDAYKQLDKQEKKLKRLYSAAGKTNSNFCELGKKQCQQDVLREHMRTYTWLLDNRLRTSKGLIYRKSGYYDDETTTQLDKLENDIKKLYKDIKQPYNDFCEKEKERRLAESAVSTKEKAKNIFLKVACPAMALMFFGYNGINYANSSAEIEKINSLMSAADAKVSEGKQGEAIKMLESAKGSYKGSFRASHYNSKVEWKLEDVYLSITKTAKQSIEKGDFASARKILAGIPKEYIENSSKLEQDIDILNDKMEDMFDDKLQNLLQAISKSNGALDSEGKATLEELQQTDPDNYWLKIIKEKLK